MLRAGKKEYTFRLGANALCRFERETSLPIGKLSGLNVENIEIRVVRALIWAGLKDHHPEMTIDMAGDVIDEIGMPQVIKVMGDGMAGFFPQPTGDENPPTAVRVGTGNGS